MESTLLTLAILVVSAPPERPMDLFREIQTVHDDYELPKFYALSRSFLKRYPGHRAADQVRYDFALQLIAENLEAPNSEAGAEARRLLVHASQHARSEDRKFEAALLLLKYEVTDDPGARAARVVKRFDRHPEVHQVHVWAVTELERRGRLEGAARWARLLLARNPKTEAAERCKRVIRRAELLGQKAPFREDERRVIERLGGKVLLVDFWATWCAPCVQTLPRLVRTHDRLHQRGLRIVGFDMDDTAEALALAVKKHAVPWPMIPSSFDTDVDERFGVQELPTYLIVDVATGRILETELEGEALFDRLEKLLE